MASSIEMCGICAWRATCSRKFSLSGREIHCPDFSEDISIKRKPEADEDVDDDQ